jgi:hypothetical protein
VHRAAGDYPPEQDRIHWRVSIKDFAAKEVAGTDCARTTAAATAPVAAT